MIVRLLTTACLLGFCLVSAATAAGDEAALKNPYEGDTAAVEQGHSLFNETCSHCHGPEAVTSISERKLRLLHLRYGDQMIQTFHTTVINGRTEAGMPSWDGILDDKTIWLIYTYLESVQSSGD